MSWAAKRYIDALNEFAILAEMAKEQDSTSQRLGAVSPRVRPFHGAVCWGGFPPAHGRSAIEELCFFGFSCFGLALRCCLVVLGWFYHVV